MADFLPGLPALALLLSWGLVWLRLRVRHAGLDLPNQRSLHEVPTPHGGGIGIVAAALLAALLLGLPWVWAVAVLALAGLSWVDDWFHLSFLLRLPVHLAVAALFVSQFPPQAWWALAGLVLLIGWSTNAYNFMDGANGLAGSMAACGFAAYGAGFALAGEVAPALWCCSIAAGALGFLAFNWHPARIFMGDVGSIPLGFLAGALGWYGVYRGGWPAWFPLLVFAPFLGDATLTLLRRALRGEKVWQAHREHLYQRMVRAGLSHGQMCVRWLAVMLAGALVALASLALPGISWFAVPAWLIALAALACAMDRRVGRGT